MAILSVVCAFTSCSSDDDNSMANLLQAPSFELIKMEPYDITLLDTQESITTTIEFTSSAAWQLSSDKIWVLFSNTEEGEYYYDLMGNAGTHKVYMKITNDARTFEPSGAKVQFTYGGGYNYSFGTIYRHAKAQDVEILDEEGVVVESVEIGSVASATISTNSNSTFGLKSYPEWLGEPELYNDAYIFKVIEEYVPFVMAGEIVFTSEDGAVEKAFPVNYSGMDPAKINLSGTYTPWAWELSLDGKTFINESSTLEGETSEVTVDGSLSYSMKCLNYDCKFVLAEENKNGSLSVVSNAWLVAEQSQDDKSLITVTAKPFTATSSVRSRKGYLFAVPTGDYNNFMAALSSATDAITFVDEHIDNVIIEATQKDTNAIEGFTVTGSDGSSFVTPAETEGDLYTWISSELSITEVYTMDGVNGVTYTINTLYTDEDWNGGYSIYDKSNNSYTNARTWKMSRKQDADGYYILTLTVPAADKFAEPVIIRMHSSNVNKKALIIKPVNN